MWFTLRQKRKQASNERANPTYGAKLYCGNRWPAFVARYHLSFFLSCLFLPLSLLEKTISGGSVSEKGRAYKVDVKELSRNRGVLLSVSPITTIQTLSISRTVPVILHIRSAALDPIPLTVPYARHANVHSSCRSRLEQPPKRDGLGCSRYVFAHTQLPPLPTSRLSTCLTPPKKATKSSLHSPSRTSTHEP